MGADAQEDCKALGGFVAEPRSASIYSYLKTKGRHIWLGLSDNETEGTWLWQSDNAAVSWNDWPSSEPGTNIAKNCAYYSTSYLKWFSRACSNEYYYICQAEKLCPM